MTFILEQADNAEWIRWWVAYRNTNEDFSQTFVEQYRDLVGVPYCQWILQDGQRVGGIIMVGRNVGDMFLIPPFDDAITALQAIVSDDVTTAMSMVDAYVPALEQLGFTIKESRRWMLRPTQSFDVQLVWEQSRPTKDHAPALAQLMYNAFHGGVGQYGERDIEAHRKSIDNYFENLTEYSIVHQASSLVFDGDTLIAACLVDMYKSLPTIRFAITHPDYQKRGIGKQLIQYAIDGLSSEYDYVSLAVTIGNPAYNLYRNMGFVDAPATHTLVR